MTGIDTNQWSNNFHFFKDFADNAGNQDDDRIQLTQSNPNQPISANNFNIHVSQIRENVFQRVFRSFDDSIANERARELFKNTIFEIYGGAERLPQTVKVAMELQNFDHMGHPLTARRVRAVINAMVPSLSLEQISQEFVNTTENHSKNLMLQYFFCKLATQCVTSKEKDYSPNIKQQDLTHANRILTFGQNKIPNGFQEIKGASKHSDTQH